MPFQSHRPGKDHLGKITLKEHIHELAIFGGAPEFDQVQHVGTPNIGNRQRLTERIDSVLDSGWLTNNGPQLQEFEGRLAEMIGVDHCLAICNGTVGLEILIRALGLSGEVIVPSFTFVATVHALEWLGIKPVFCDIGATSHHIDPELVESLITPETTGILGVHAWGQACDTAALEAIAEKRGLSLIFDAAHALACTHEGRNIGGNGLGEVFSFHATKFFNTFEGGAITTNDFDLAEKIRLMRNFGFAGRDNVVSRGTNGKMNEISAAMGLTSLESLDEFIEVNRACYDRYYARLAGLPGVFVIEYSAQENFNFQYVVAEIDAEEAGLDRDTLVELLNAERVAARRYFYPGCHQMEPYRSLYPEAGAQLPETERVAGRVFVLPTGPSVGEEGVDRICDLVQFALQYGGAIREKRRGG